MNAAVHVAALAAALTLTACGPVESGTIYKTCDDARAAGHAPMHAGDMGYSRQLDQDGDGVACE